MARFLLILFAALSLTGQPARAEGIKERCARITEDNASYGNCINRLSAEESKDLAYKLCNGDTCIFRLACQGGTCIGSGFRVTYTSSDSGRDITIRDPKKRITSMSQCGTCKWLDYESGPLKGADIKMSGSGSIVLEVPKSQL